MLCRHRRPDARRGPPRPGNWTTCRARPGVTAAPGLAHGQHAIDHHPCLAEVMGRVAQPRQRLAVEVPADLRVPGEQVEQRPVRPQGLAAEVVHEIVRVLAADAWVRGPSSPPRTSPGRWSGRCWPASARRRPPGPRGRIESAGAHPRSGRTRRARRSTRSPTARSNVRDRRSSRPSAPQRAGGPPTRRRGCSTRRSDCASAASCCSTRDRGRTARTPPPPRSASSA